jgi:hypothetical protein
MCSTPHVRRRVAVAARRLHKPHHTIVTAPYLSHSVLTEYIKAGAANSMSLAGAACVPFKRRNSTGS